MGAHTEYSVSSDIKPDLDATLCIFKADEDIPFSRKTSYGELLETDQWPIRARTIDASFVGQCIVSVTSLSVSYLGRR